MKYIRLLAGLLFLAPHVQAQPRPVRAAEEPAPEPLVGGVTADREAPGTLRGVELGMRVGVAVPGGDVGDEVALSESVAVSIPLGVDLGYRLSPNLGFGLTFAYGLASHGSDACDFADCSASTMDLGVALQYHGSPLGKADPWVSIGTGFSWLNESIEGEGLELSRTASGFDYLRLQAGVDKVLGKPRRPTGGIGPFAFFTIGQYNSFTADCTGEPCVELVEGEFAKKAVHYWIGAGLRGTFVLGGR